MSDERIGEAIGRAVLHNIDDALRDRTFYLHDGPESDPHPAAGCLYCVRAPGLARTERLYREATERWPEAYPA